MKETDEDEEDTAVLVWDESHGRDKLVDVVKVEDDIGGLLQSLTCSFKHVILWKNLRQVMH